MAKRVYIGIGHGGSDPGACAGVLRESDLNLQMGFLLLEELNRCGLDAWMSRRGDVDFPTVAKVADANDWGADAVVDLHHNAGGGAGFEIYCSRRDDGSRELARAIEEEIAAGGRRSRGVKTHVVGGVDYFGMIRQTAAPAVLIEYGFVDHPEDAGRITDPLQQREWAAATAKGICAALEVEYVREDTREFLYRVQVGAFRSPEGAEAFAEMVAGMGLEAFRVTGRADGLYRIQVGAFQEEENARQYLKSVADMGLEAFLIPIER